MKLNHRIFLGYFLVIAIAGLFLLKSVSDEFRPAVRQSMEETMVDVANLLAEIVKDDVLRRNVTESPIAEVMQNFLARKMNAEIWGLLKEDTSFNIYITDHQGIVLYDSGNPDAVGQDYFRWIDVRRTLQGKYGARTTHALYDDEKSSVMYVAAPIINNGQIIGVLSVYKPSISVLPFIQLSQQNITQAATVLFLFTLALGWWLSHYLTRSTRTLLEYVNLVEQGEKVTLPPIKEKELAQLGSAIEDMKQALEGKEYVENYVHALTHELKSPLTGVKGAAELLKEDLPKEDQVRFISNIQNETQRIQDIVDKLLDLARLEKQQQLEQRETIDLPLVLADQLQYFDLPCADKNIQWAINLPKDFRIQGDPFLLGQAIHNILDNALDFSPDNSHITISGNCNEHSLSLTITDEGTGIPDYAKDRVFERFYSLPRPDTGKKSTGLGLSFVKEVMSLHHGSISIETIQTGCRVTLNFPV
ncbi:two-component system sensor histidine kinase CreC [Terasakiella sp. A23]|uniref:two-component system sensor histidine kinase CreC n=1 Tax=Terasakiella sp. FCG-A23 TaxID=3080561 RepID=UPI0029529901|nr:two-component system sensor histidine kinase CreC [Terasakiella sp. A23]MDV7339977.1 two-component system sensor histidine kinase CreC [Terasakiella sp. A23]